MLQRLTILLRNAETVKDILMGIKKPKSQAQSAVERFIGPRAVLDRGTSAELVTMEEVVEKRREKDAEELKILHWENEQFCTVEMRLIKAGNTRQSQQQRENV